MNENVFAYMQADMSGKQLAAQNLTAKSAVELNCKVEYLENELSRCREELICVNLELEAAKKEAKQDSQSAQRLSRWSLAVAVCAMLFTAAGFIFGLILR